MSAKRIISPIAVAAIFCALLPAESKAQSYEAYIDSTDNYIKRERWDDAARCIRESLRINPGSPLNSKLFSNLGICLTKTGDLNGALEAFEISLVREPDSPATLSARATTYTLLGNDDAALADLSRSLALDSLQQSALRLHGQLLLVKNRYEEAEQNFKTLLNNFPSDPWGSAGLGECAVNREEYAKAIPLFRDALKLSDSPDFHISLIHALLMDGKLAAAEEAINTALKEYSNVGEIYLLRGILHKKLYQNSDMELDKKLAKEYGVDQQTIDIYLPDKETKIVKKYLKN